MNDSLLLVLRILTACSSLIMILSPSPAIYRVHKNQNVGHMSIFSLCALFGNCHMWMMYGYLKGNIFPVFITFATGDLIALFFIAVYLRYTTERTYVLKVIGTFGFIYLLVTIYAILGLTGVTNQTHAQMKPIIGYIAIAAAIMLYGAPFEKMFLVLKHKTSVFIPFHMVIVGTINNCLWVIYTPFDHNWFMFVTNAICGVLGFFQLSLYFIYHPSRGRAHKESNVTVEFDAEHSGIPVVIVIETPKTDSASGKHYFPESPSFQLMHSPLAPLQTVECVH